VTSTPTSPDLDPGRGARALAVRPDALLLDFGGVVFETRRRPDAMAEVVTHVHEVLARAGHHIPAADLLPVLSGGNKALKDWKNAASRRLSPRELTHREIWGDFYGAPLPAAAREVLVGSAGALQEVVTLTRAEHVVRPGIPALIALAAELGVPLGIVSNAHSGRAHRALMARHGLDEAFGVQVYSDEVGIRKPNPAIIELAANALGTTADRCWYVGDTFDRDVVAGRRARAGAVVLTRHHSTDDVPFPVSETADAVLDTPEALVDLLRTARPPRHDLSDPRVTRVTRGSDRSGGPSALLLDHGGVISVSVPDDDARLAFAERLARRLIRAGYPVSPADAERVVADTRGRHKTWKAAHDDADVVREIDATTFWTELAAPSLLALLGEDRSKSLGAWLRAEAHPLMLDYARSKSLPTVRPGVKDLLAAADAAGVPVAVVSNTVCGRAVREELVEAGIDHLIGAHVYSDELGRRKPDPLMPATALRALDADPARAWFVGDKPHRDVLAARRAGVGTVVLVRGGSTPDAALDAVLAGPRDAPGRPDHVIAAMGDLLHLLDLHPHAPAGSLTP
jgi:HAD superfamily hydrolase (TIGR01549 family)/HAD superfamily hydrolase (TIGR01509 family)